MFILSGRFTWLATTSGYFPSHCLLHYFTPGIEATQARTTCQVCPLLVNNVKKMTQLAIGHTVLLQSITQHYKTFVGHPLGIRHNMRHGIVDMCRIDVAKIVDMYN